MAFKITNWVTGHPKRIIVLWIGLWCLSLFFAVRLPGTLTTGGFNNPRSPSAHAQRVIAEDFPHASPNTVVALVRRRTETVANPAFHTAVNRLAWYLQHQPAVAAVSTYYTTHATALVGDHGHATILAIRLRATSGNAAQNLVPALKRTIARHIGPRFQWWVTGGPALNESLNIATLHGVSRAEQIAFPLLLLILLLVLGTIGAALVPLLLAGMVLPITMAVAYAIARQSPLNVLLTDAISMIGLGVIVDYAVFIISRYRQERMRYETPVAIQRALTTSGRAVFFSGLTVMVSLLALLLPRLMILTSIAVGGALVVGWAVLASWTLLPALLMVLGPFIERGRLPWYRPSPEAGSRGWTRWATGIMRRPWRILLPGIVLLSLFMVPVTQLHMQVPVASARALPATSSARQGLVQLERHFPYLDLFPIDVVVQSHGTPMASPQNLRQVADMVRVLQRLSTVARVQGPTTWQPQWSVADYVRVYRHWPSLPPLEQQQASAWLSPRHPQVALIAVDSTQSANSLRTHQLVDRIRQTLSRMPLQGLTVFVGGQTAVGYDFDQAVTQSFPLMIVVVLGVSGLLLAWTFRSLILPLQALVLNGLVTLASLGVLVAVFQQGLWGLLPSHHTVNSVTPVVLFGLSMDYEVFIVSRIREKHEAGATTEHSIIAGVSETSRLVTGAAVIMIAVFVAFATVPIGVVQQLGIGLATAIFLDAVIVRTTLVPAVMRLLGERNWWGRRWWNQMSGDSHHNGNTALCPENR